MDDRRLYEVGPAGTAWTIREEPEARARRLHRRNWLYAIGMSANAATWTLAGLGYVIGGSIWGARLGALALATLPLLALPLMMEAVAWLRARRRHARRPAGFGN